MPLSDADRAPWLNALAGWLRQKLQAGDCVVLACSALRQAHRDQLGVDQRRIVTVYLEGSPALIAARIAKRAHAFMPSSLLQSQFDALEPPTEGIRVAIDEDPDTVCQRVIDAMQSGWQLRS